MYCFKVSAVANEFLCKPIWKLQKLGTDNWKFKGNL